MLDSGFLKVNEHSSACKYCLQSLFTFRRYSSLQIEVIYFFLSNAVHLVRKRTNGWNWNQRKQHCLSQCTVLSLCWQNPPTLLITPAGVNNLSCVFKYLTWGFCTRHFVFIENSMHHCGLYRVKMSSLIIEIGVTMNNYSEVYCTHSFSDFCLTWTKLALTNYMTHRLCYNIAKLWLTELI